MFEIHFSKDRVQVFPYAKQYDVDDKEHLEYERVYSGKVYISGVSG